MPPPTTSTSQPSSGWASAGLVVGLVAGLGDEVVGKVALLLLVDANQRAVVFVFFLFIPSHVRLQR
jgi:hypothetical protein